MRKSFRNCISLTQTLIVGGTMLMLTAPAGSGKTQCMANLRHQTVTGSEGKVLILTYNTKAKVNDIIVDEAQDLDTLVTSGQGAADRSAFL